MGRPKKKNVQNRKKKILEDKDAAEYVGTVVHEEVSLADASPVDPIVEEQLETEEPDYGEDIQVEKNMEAEVNDTNGGDADEPEGEIELSEEHERPAKRKKHRGPTKMKNIAKDPNVRERVDYTTTGDACGPGSVKLSSYVGPLVREHIPYNIEGWKNVSKDLKTVLWKSVQARFELDEEFQKTAVIRQMGCLWRTSKSLLVKSIMEAPNNQQRMNLRPKNINPTEWRKFVKLKTSPAFKAVSDKYKERRSKQIPHTCSRKGMVRLTEEMKMESEDPSDVTRLKVWVRSRTKKNGTPVNTTAAEKIRKAAELVSKSDSSTTANPEEDQLAQILGPDNPGRLRAMGRGMSKTKFACFQLKNKCMADMEEKQVQLVQKVHQLQSEIEKIKKQGHEPEIGENLAARSVNKKSPPKCLLVDWSGSEENIAEGRIISSDPDDLVNDFRLGPSDLKILVEKSIKPDTFLWRPASNIYTVEEAVGKMIAWPASKCVLLDKGLQLEDIAPAGLRLNSMNKCKLLDLSSDDVIVAEGRWETQDRSALVNGLHLGPMAVKVFVDIVHVHETFIWRPSMEKTYLEDCLMAFVAWPVNKVVFDNHQDATGRKSPLSSSAATNQPSGEKSIASRTKSVGWSSKDACGKSPIEESPPTVIASPVKKTLQEAQSPLRRSKRNQDVVKDNKKCMLMDVSGKKRVVAEGRWFSNDPNQNVHFVPLGENAVRVWVDIVKVRDAAVWRPSSDIECMEDAIGTSIAWPEDKVIMS